MLVPPRAAAEEGLRPIALSRASSARLEPRSSSGAMLFRATEAAAAAAALCRHRDGGAEPSLAPQRQWPLDAFPQGTHPPAASGARPGTHSKRCEPGGSWKNRELGVWTTLSLLHNPLPLDSASSHGFGEGSRNTLHLIFLGRNPRLS